MVYLSKKNKGVAVTFVVVGCLAQIDGMIGFALSTLVALYILFAVFRLLVCLGQYFWKRSSEAISLVRASFFKLISACILLAITIHGATHIFGQIERRYQPDIEQLELYKQHYGMYPQVLEALNQPIQICPGTMPLKPMYSVQDNGSNYCLSCPAIMGDKYTYCSKSHKWGTF